MKELRTKHLPANFEEDWLPRIGPEASLALSEILRWRWAKAAILLGAVFGAPALIWSAGGPVGVTLGVAAYLSGAAVLGLTVSKRPALARALSRHFGTSIGATQLPVMSPDSFDRWQAKRGVGSHAAPSTPNQRRGLVVALAVAMGFVFGMAEAAGLHALGLVPLCVGAWALWKTTRRSASSGRPT